VTGWTRREIESLLRVNRAVALQSQLADVLDVIAAEACHVTRANAASILLIESGDSFHLAASTGLSPSYERFLRSQFISTSLSLSRAAIDELKPIVVDDVLTDSRVNRPEAREWKRVAMRENYHAVVSVPLVAGNANAGVLNLYRAEPGPWLRSEIEVAATFGQYAAGAIHSARLIDSQRRQVDALERLVAVLRDQTHEYANRLQAVSGLLSLGEMSDAQDFIAQLMALHHDSHASVIDRVQPPILAGLLIAQMSIARQRGVEIQIDPETNIDQLPPSIGAAEAVSILANLIENAVEAVTAQPPARRRALVRITADEVAVAITVRDWGPGIRRGMLNNVTDRGRSSKDGHHGIGLALVSEVVAAAHGTLTIRNMRPGAMFVVKLPSRHDGL
jgi:signal transduction histidine kinase